LDIAKEIDMSLERISAKTLKTLADKLATYNTHPVYAAVLPLRAAAMQRGEDKARKMVASMTAELEAAGMDREIVAPYPSSHMSRNDYLSAKARYDRFHYFTRSVKGSRRMSEPDICTVDAAAVERFVEMMIEAAAFSYDQFIFKLVQKIGAAATATLSTRSNVWGESFLDVTFDDKAPELWKTQEIWNVSKLGLHFPQWPSRKVKSRG
jgi:hypothetical protein